MSTSMEDGALSPDSRGAQVDPALANDLVLGIDAGGSSTRWLLQDGAGEARGSGRVGPVSGIALGSLDEDDSPAFVELTRLATEVAGVGAPSWVVAGVTGLDAGSPEARRLEAFLAARLALDADRVGVLGDVITAYLATFAPGEGVLVYAGTGSVALHLAADGSSVRAGGHGFLVDDAGGGYWIGREALKLLLRRVDVVGGPVGGPLASAVFTALGGSDWPTVRTAVYGGGRSRLAALTPLVAHAASRGDEDAVAVLAAAGRELARLASVVSGRVGLSLPVALAGGVAACGEPLLGPLRDALPAGASFRVSASEPVEAAVRLAGRLRSGAVALPGSAGGTR